MTIHILNDIYVDFDECKKLHSNISYGKVGIHKKEPLKFVDFSGLEIDSVYESDIVGRDKSIITDLPNSYKDYGISVENLGYFIIPRSVTSDPRYKGARLKYKHVLNILFENVAFSPTTHAIGCQIIPISIGQYCVSIRGLMDLCNAGTKHKEDKLSKNCVDRALSYFEKCQFVGQEVRHGKTIITITIPEFYERYKKKSGTDVGTKAGHERDTKEESKEDKEDNISTKQVIFEPSSFATSLLSEFYSSLFSAIPDYPKESAKKTKSQYQAADRIGKKANNDMDLIRKVIEYAHKSGGFWLSLVHSVSYLDKKFITLVQQLRDQGNRPMNGQRPRPIDKIPKSLNKELDERIKQGGIEISRRVYDKIVEKADRENRPEDKKGYIVNEPNLTRTIT